MTLNELNKSETHCIKVTKFTDWTYQLTRTEWIADILENVDFSTIVDEFIVPSGKVPRIVWSADHQFTKGLPATVTIVFESGCEGEMIIGINGKVQHSLNEGECHTFEVEHLKTIEISCDGDEGEFMGLFEIEFNPNLFLSWLYSSDVKCFLSNQEGILHHSHKLPPITCTEVPQMYGRDSLTLTLPDWNTVVLQKVKVMKVGYVIFHFFYNRDCIFTTEPIKFIAEDKVLLKAPKHTEVDCEVLEADCQVDEINIGDSGISFEIKLKISLYQKIMSVEEVIVEVEGHFSKPRIV
ncbi:S-Ena type endospore appendage [Fredinandcohnia sp. FSL W7-1320]|uniref:S-Ena type endospore appendage n=1 Tax=Fredinandcohnia sp. FSL W7-1320 TaxID=2954540 RepID=UPI0030FDE265